MDRTKLLQSPKLYIPVISIFLLGIVNNAFCYYALKPPNKMQICYAVPDDKVLLTVEPPTPPSTSKHDPHSPYLYTDAPSPDMDMEPRLSTNIATRFSAFFWMNFACISSFLLINFLQIMSVLSKREDAYDFVLTLHVINGCVFLFAVIFGTCTRFSNEGKVCSGDYA